MFEWISRKTIIRTILILIIASYIMRLAGIGNISDTLLLGMIGHSIALIGLKAWEDINYSRENTENEKNITGFNAD